MNRSEYYNEPLSRHTTFKIGGIAECLCIPSSKDELIEKVMFCKKKKIPYYVIGRGSNLLICDEGLKGIVIKNTEACRTISVDDNYLVKVGSSIELQKLIAFGIENNLSGIEYLHSVPGNVGGAIWMNAGRGRAHKLSISDHVVSVEIFDGKEIRIINNKDCCFDYRSSIFHKKREWIILSAVLQLHYQDKEISRQKIKERIELVRKTQDLGYPNAGTIFKQKFKPLPEIIGHRIGNAMFSEKTPGWIINLGDATFSDVYRLINYSIECHRRRHLSIPKLEIVLFQQSRWKRLEYKVRDIYSSVIRR